MSSAEQSKDLTQLIVDAQASGRAAVELAMPLLYSELQQMAASHLRRERADHTLTCNALVHEAFLKLIDQTRVEWKGRAHFFGIAALCMRRILLNHARDRVAQKRGGELCRVTLLTGHATDECDYSELIALDDALERLARRDPRQARIVEMRFFGGLSHDEVAEALGLSESTVRLDWRMARAWLSKELG